MIYDNSLLITEEAMYSKDFKHPIFIVLMHSGTPMANAIKMVTHDAFSHACISFNSNLNPLYSFGSKGNGEKGLGLSINSPKDIFFTKFKAKYSVYCMFVTSKAYKAMTNRLNWFTSHKDSLKYDFIGLIDIWRGKSSEDHEKFFCSRFVMDIISKSQNLSKVPSLWKPSDITNLSNISLVNRGYDFYNYDKNVTEKHVNAIKNNTYKPEKVMFENISSGAESDYQSKKDISLSKFSKMRLNDAVVQVYKQSYPRLSHIRINNKTKGYVWLDGEDLVAMVNTEEKKDDEIWIQALEVFSSYRGHGLSKQVLDVACKDLHATHLSVNKQNELAIKVYKKYGFVKYDETESMLMMSTKDSINESFAGMTDEELHKYANTMKLPYVDNDYILTAKYVQSKLTNPESECSLEFCSPLDIEKVTNKWQFAKYDIDVDGDVQRLSKFILIMNKRLQATAYPGYIPIPENLYTDKSGILYIQEGLSYDFDDNIVTEKTVKYYVDPAKTLRTKLGRKRNDRVRLGQYDIPSFDPANPPKISVSSNKPTNTESESAEELKEAACKANKMIREKLSSIPGYNSICIDCMEPYGEAYSVITWNESRLDSKYLNEWTTFKNMVYESVHNIFKDIHKGYTLKMNNSYIYVEQTKP